MTYADYVTAAEVKTQLGVSGAALDTIIGRAISAASDDIAAWCGRDFSAGSVGTTRTVIADNYKHIKIPDFSAVTAVDVDSTDDGTFNQSWTVSTDYVLLPVDSVVDGIDGYPFTSVMAVGSLSFPIGGTYGPIGRVRITGTPGWAAIPDDVEQAALVLAAERVRMKDSSYGVVGFGDLGAFRVRENGMVRAMLSKYRHPSRAMMVL